MAQHLDELIDRRPTESVKWKQYGDDVLPMWVADMDFPSPEPVIRALRERVDHGVFGYGREPQELREILVARLEHLYGWSVSPDSIVFLPGVIPGIHVSCRAFVPSDEAVLVQTPVYPPIVNAAATMGLVSQEMELTREHDGTYTVDMDAFEAAINSRTRLFILCNPHNPVGRVFRRDELERMAEACLRRGVLICSDEIHGDLIFGESRHMPIASLSPEVAAQTVTLMAPSKTFNIAGLHCAFAVIPSPSLRQAFEVTRRGLVGHPSILAYIAATAAYRDGGPWLAQVLRYLEGNRDYLLEHAAAYLPGVHIGKPEGTYLAWLDCRHAGIPDDPHEFFLDRARVAVVDGAHFGRGGEGFVRLNFGCPRSLLQESLARMQASLEALV